MVHTNVFMCALLSLKPGTIHGILQLKAEVDQVIKYAINYTQLQILTLEKDQERNTAFCSIWVTLNLFLMSDFVYHPRVTSYDVIIISVNLCVRTKAG